MSGLTHKKVLQTRIFSLACMQCMTGSMALLRLLPHPGQGSCPVRPPAGRGQSGAQSGAARSRPAPAPSAAARPRWRTTSGLRGACTEEQATAALASKAAAEAADTDAAAAPQKTAQGRATHRQQTLAPAAAVMSRARFAICRIKRARTSQTTKECGPTLRLLGTGSR